jgi:hypothetical protein
MINGNNDTSGKIQENTTSTKTVYYSYTNHKQTERELRMIIEESNKLPDTIKEQLKEAKRNREDESELDKIRSQIEELQNLVEKARKKIRPFHKPHFLTQIECPQSKQAHTGPHRHHSRATPKAGGHSRN